MRTILYRGKSTYTGEWVYGFYVNKGGKKHQIVTDNDTFPKEVIIESVGQLTGLKDKNGNDIYEGDIIEVSRIFGFHSDLLTEWQEMHNLPHVNGIGCLFTGVVKMDIKRGLMLKRLDNDYAEPFFSRRQSGGCYLDMDTCVIIGNIYDKPELLSP